MRIGFLACCVCSFLLLFGSGCEDAPNSGYGDIDTAGVVDTTDSTGALRESPVGVVDQLILAYETMNLGLFLDLISEHFHFYVSPSFAQEYAERFGARSETVADSTYPFISGGRYYYWVQTGKYRPIRDYSALPMRSRSLPNPTRPPRQYVTSLA